MPSYEKSPHNVGPSAKPGVDSAPDVSGQGPRAQDFNSNLSTPEWWRAGQVAPTLRVEGPITSEDRESKDQSRELDMRRYGEAYKPTGYQRDADVGEFQYPSGQ